MNILNIEHVSKVFGEKVVLDDVSYGVHQGDKIGIIGINGTGKSTILKIIGGLEEPDEGQVITQNGLRITYLPKIPEFPQGASVLDYVAEHIHAGITTEQIDLWVYEQTTHRGGIPAPLNYEGFPKSVCTSANDQVCHGIPSADVILKDGDIINVDVSTIYNGYFSDSSRMFCIGEVSPEKNVW